jgi:hypothetical protein
LPKIRHSTGTFRRWHRRDPIAIADSRSDLLENHLGGFIERHFIWFGRSLESTAAARLMQVHR